MVSEQCIQVVHFSFERFEFGEKKEREEKREWWIERRESFNLNHSTDFKTV